MKKTLLITGYALANIFAMVSIYSCKDSHATTTNNTTADTSIVADGMINKTDTSLIDTPQKVK